MEYEDGIPALLARGAVCGAIAWIAVLGTTWLLVVGPTSAESPATVGRLFVDAHYPLTSGPIVDLAPVTWFELPPRILHLLFPVLLASAGVVAGRLTRTADLWIGVRAGLTVVVGYVPLLAAVALWVDGDVGVVVVATVIALVCGAIGGIVGVRT